ncbi:hypothetical protein ERJ75_000899300 [Trypanosoma vivax]|nr:hypothetical protein ERJ75_000899300 [Trypanosoma vivax]
MNLMPSPLLAAAALSKQAQAYALLVPSQALRHNLPQAHLLLAVMRARLRGQQLRAGLPGRQSPAMVFADVLADEPVADDQSPCWYRSLLSARSTPPRFCESSTAAVHGQPQRAATLRRCTAGSSAG